MWIRAFVFKVWMNVWVHWDDIPFVGMGLPVRIQIACDAPYRLLTNGTSTVLTRDC